jgi:hypothetical protein
MGECRDEARWHFRNPHLVQPDTVGFINEAEDSIFAGNREEQMASSRRDNSGFHLSNGATPLRIAPDAVIEQRNNDGRFRSIKVE